MIEVGKFYRRSPHIYDGVRYAQALEGNTVDFICMGRMQRQRVNAKRFAQSHPYQVPAHEPVKPYAHIITVGEQQVWHTYKQSFPMQFWYSLHAHELFAEGSNEWHLFDVRALPERYTSGLEISVSRLDGVLSPLDASRRERAAHCAAIARALADGFDIRRHQTALNERAAQEQQRWRERRAALPDNPDIPF